MIFSRRKRGRRRQRLRHSKPRRLARLGTAFQRSRLRVLPNGKNALASAPMTAGVPLVLSAFIATSGFVTPGGGSTGRRLRLWRANRPPPRQSTAGRAPPRGDRRERTEVSRSSSSGVRRATGTTPRPRRRWASAALPRVAIRTTRWRSVCGPVTTSSTAEPESLSARGDIALVRGASPNSDRRPPAKAKWTLPDTQLWLALPCRDIPTTRRRRTPDLIVRAPQLVLPTSKVSCPSGTGKILGLGFVGSASSGAVPLRGRGSRFLASARARANARYRYQFASSVVPTNEGIGPRSAGAGRSLAAGRSALRQCLRGPRDLPGDLSGRAGKSSPGLTLLAEFGFRMCSAGARFTSR